MFVFEIQVAQVQRTALSADLQEVFKNVRLHKAESHGVCESPSPSMHSGTAGTSESSSVVDVHSLTLSESYTEIHEIFCKQLLFSTLG